MRLLEEIAACSDDLAGNMRAESLFVKVQVGWRMGKTRGSRAGYSFGGDLTQNKAATNSQAAVAMSSETRLGGR